MGKMYEIKSNNRGAKTVIMGIVIMIIISVFGSSVFAAQSPSTEIFSDAGTEDPSPNLAVEKPMRFFLHFVNATETAKTLPDSSNTWTYFDTSLDWNDENVTLFANGQNWEYNWYLTPSLAGNFTTSEYTFRIWGNASGAAAVNLQTTVEIYRVNAGGEFLVDTENYASVNYPINPTLKNFTKAFPSTEFLPGESIRVRFAVNAGISQVYFYYDTARANSRVEFKSDDSFGIENIRTLDYQDTPKTNFESDAANTTIKVRTNLTDPFGTYDIKWVNLTLQDPNDNTILNNVTMWKISGTPIDYRAEYNYTWNYSAYTSTPGRYNITIWAVDNNGHNWYYHFGEYNFGSYHDMAESYFYIGGLPNYVWVKALDNSTAPLKGASVVATVANTPASANFTNETGMTNLTVYPGTYDFRVMWNDIFVGNVTAAISANVTENNPLVIDCSVYYPVLRALDSQGFALENAALYLKHPNGTQLEPILTNDTGDASLSQVPIGDYYVVVRWRGIAVYDATVRINSSAVYVLNCRVYYVTFKAVDTQGTPLSDIGIAVFDNATGLILDFKQTDFEGNATTRIPAGKINVEAYWQNNLVNETNGLLITGDDYIVIECWIYAVVFHVTDSQNEPVQNAQVVIRTAPGGEVLDSVITDLSGNASSTLPAGNYYIEVFWHTVNVNKGYVTINEAAQVIPVQAWIYYVTFHTTDSQGLAVANAQVTATVSSSGAPLGSGLTDAEGNITLRLPKVLVGLEVYWQSTLVNSSTYDVVADAYVNVICSVYYVTFHTVDSADAAVADAQIIVMDEPSGAVIDTDTTDGSGQTTIRLPVGTYSIEVYWLDVLVNETVDYNADGDAAFTIDCWIYYAEFTALDSHDIPIVGAQVVMLKGGVVESVLQTDTNGKTVHRLPVGNYAQKTYWRDVLVYEGIVELTSDMSVDVECWVYYLDVNVKGSDGKGISGAYVVTSSGNETFDSKYTGAEGSAVFRLPVGDYTVTVRYKGEHLLTNVDIEVSDTVAVDSDKETTLTFAEYPPSLFTTNLFFLAVLLAILTLVLIFLFLKLRSRGPSPISNQGEGFETSEEPGSAEVTEAPAETMESDPEVRERSEITEEP